MLICGTPRRPWLLKHHHLIVLRCVLAKFLSNQDVLYNLKVPFFRTGGRRYSWCDYVVYSAMLK